MDTVIVTRLSAVHPWGDYALNKQERNMIEEKESEQLINELESIYLQNGWRQDKKLSDREKIIKKRLNELLKV